MTLNVFLHTEVEAVDDDGLSRRHEECRTTVSSGWWMSTTMRI